MNKPHATLLKRKNTKSVSLLIRLMRTINDKSCLKKKHIQLLRKLFFRKITRTIFIYIKLDDFKMAIEIIRYAIANKPEQQTKTMLETTLYDIYPYRDSIIEGDGQMYITQRLIRLQI